MNGNALKEFYGNPKTEILSITLVITVGYAFLLLMPGLVGGMVDNLGLTTKQAGWVASSQMFGMMLGTLSALGLRRCCPTLTLMISFAGLTALMDFASVFAASAEMLIWVRFASGMAAGVTTGIAAAAIAGMRQPDRAAAIIFAAQFFFGMLGLALLPQIRLFGGMKGAFVFLALLSLLVVITLVSLRANIILPKNWTVV